MPDGARRRRLRRGLDDADAMRIEPDGPRRTREPAADGWKARFIRRTPLLAALATCCLAAPARPDMADALAARGWREIVFDGYAENRWIAIPGGVRVISDRSVSILFRPLAADLARRPILRWRWRTSTAPAPTDLTRTKGEDRALGVYVGFPYEPDRASFWEALKRRTIVALRGEEAPGRLLTYVWGGDRPRGTVLRRDADGDAGAIRILRTPSAPVNAWLSERVDVAADFRAAFGWQAPNPTHIGIVSDSDDTGRAIDASVVDIAYEAR